jgi:hypothetical protein
MLLGDGLLLFRNSIAASSLPFLTTSADVNAAESSQTDSLALASHLYFSSPLPQCLSLDSSTRFISTTPDTAAVDLRSIYFAWVKKDVPVNEYIALAQELDGQLPEGQKIRNLVFVERLDLITWLEGASDESEYIKPLEGPEPGTAPAPARGADPAGGAAVSTALGAGPAVGQQVGPGGRATKIIDARLQEIYNGERLMGDRNSVLRGIKPTVSRSFTAVYIHKSRGYCIREILFSFLFFLLFERCSDTSLTRARTSLTSEKRPRRFWGETVSQSLGKQVVRANLSKAALRRWQIGLSRLLRNLQALSRSVKILSSCSHRRHPHYCGCRTSSLFSIRDSLFRLIIPNFRLRRQRICCTSHDLCDPLTPADARTGSSSLTARNNSSPTTGTVSWPSLPRDRFGSFEATSGGNRKSFLGTFSVSTLESGVRIHLTKSKAGAQRSNPFSSNGGTRKHMVQTWMPKQGRGEDGGTAKQLKAFGEPSKIT